MKKNLRIAFINGFDSVFLKIIKFRRTKHTNFCSRFVVVFNVFGERGGAGVKYLGPYYTKK